MTNGQQRDIIERCKSNDLFLVYLFLFIILLNSCSTEEKVHEIKKQINEMNHVENEQVNP